MNYVHIIGYIIINFKFSYLLMSSRVTSTLYRYKYTEGPDAKSRNLSR